MSREQRETINVITHGTRNVELRDSNLRARGSQLCERGLESASTASLSESGVSNCASMIDLIHLPKGEPEYRYRRSTWCRRR